jgi:hypothetical protein
MKKMLTRMLAALFMAVSFAAVAGGWGHPVIITGYYVWDSGSAFITTSSNENPDGCATTHYLYLDTSQPFFRELYATIMAAQASGQTVSLSYSGCVGSYPHVNSVAVPNTW